MNKPDTGPSGQETWTVSDTSLDSDASTMSAIFANASQQTRDKLAVGFAKINMLKLVRNQQKFDRDSRYLHNKAVAVRRTMGLEMPEEPDDETVLGDKIIQQGNSFGIPAAILGASILASVIAWKYLDNGSSPPPDNSDKITSVVPGFGSPVDRD